MRILAFSVAFVILAGSTTPASQSVTYHFLKVEGKAHFLEVISLNGQLVIRSKLISLDLPVYVTRHLQQGTNTLEIEYASHRTEGLKIFIEERRRGPSERKTLVKFSSAAGETQGETVRKVIKFTPSLKFPPPITLHEADRQAILNLIKAYHNALAAKNSARVFKFTERAVKEESAIYPEGMKFYQASRQELITAAFSSPGFKMKPLQLDGFAFLVAGDTVVVDRPSELPVISSEEFVVEEEVAFVINGREVREKLKGRTSLSPRSLSFKKYGREWHFTISFGLASLLSARGENP